MFGIEAKLPTLQAEVFFALLNLVILASRQEDVMLQLGDFGNYEANNSLERKIIHKLDLV